MKLQQKSLVLLLFFFLGSCDFRVVKSLSNEASQSIEESRKNGFLVATYRPRSFAINDSIKFEVLEVFAERPHRLKSYGDYSYVKNSTEVQLVIVADKKIWEIPGYSDKWEFKNESGIADRKIIINLGRQIPDTAVVPLSAIDIDTLGKAGRNDGVVLGVLKLVRKKW